jgi:hypothetical protein
MQPKTSRWRRRVDELVAAGMDMDRAILNAASEQAPIVGTRTRSEILSSGTTTSSIVRGTVTQSSVVHATRVHHDR